MQQVAGTDRKEQPGPLATTSPVLRVVTSNWVDHGSDVGDGVRREMSDVESFHDGSRVPFPQDNDQDTDGIEVTGGELAIEKTGDPLVERCHEQ